MLQWTKVNTFHWRYNSGAYSKLALGPLWADINDALKKTRNIDSVDDMKDKKMPRFYLASGHDTTVMPFLISLGDTVWDEIWPVYASIVLIEVRKSG